ncbi:MAG: hypothetical protein ACREKS_15565 [Candidatus Rokuibacteriota bacterium]
MRLDRSIWKAIAIGVAIYSALPSIPVVGATSVLGTARGVRSANLSMDGGKSWLAVGPRSLPVVEGAEIRNASGTVMLDLADGSRVSVLPFTTLRFTETDGVTEISLSHGRLTFRLPERTRVHITTPSARLEPVRRQPMVGELLVGGAELMGLKMSQGSLQVKPLATPGRVLLASLTPVFVPEKPKATGMFFTADSPTAVPANARAVFMASGESVGYLPPDGGLVIAPGFTADLTGAVPAKLVQLAKAQIPQGQASDAAPLFDVNGGYLGYLVGPMFHAQVIQAEPPSTPPPPPKRDFGLSRGAKIGLAAGAGLVVVAGVGLAAGGGGGGGGGGGSPPPATR